MPGDTLDCLAARSRLAAYLNGADTTPELGRHLAACESCQEALIEASLRQPVRVRIPPGFSQQVLAKARVDSGPDVFPYTATAAAVLFAVWGVRMISSGAAAAAGEWLRASLGPAAWPLLFSLLALEALLAVLWCWRTSRT